MSANTIYTWGYTGATPADLTAYIDALDAYVCDIRYSPRSRVPHWRQHALDEMAGVTAHGRRRYRHIIELGNVNYATDGPIELYAPAAGLREIAPYLAVRPCILLCACADWRTCHRRVVADLIVEAAALAGDGMIRVEHLPARFGAWQAGTGVAL
jgi:uncharacterized protein (DUF488 family)